MGILNLVRTLNNFNENLRDQRVEYHEPGNELKVPRFAK